jgi:Coenzyme A transferase
VIFATARTCTRFTSNCPVTARKAPTRSKMTTLLASRKMVVPTPLSFMRSLSSVQTLQLNILGSSSRLSSTQSSVDSSHRFSCYSLSLTSLLQVKTREIKDSKYYKQSAGLIALHKRYKSISTDNRPNSSVQPSHSDQSPSIPSSASKVVSSTETGLSQIDFSWPRGTTVAIGGFGTGGVPETWIEALRNYKPAHGLHVISLTAGTESAGIGRLMNTKPCPDFGDKVERVIASYVGENAWLEQEFFAGRLQVELTPQGTLAERLRAAGAGEYNVDREW